MTRYLLLLLIPLLLGCRQKQKTSRETSAGEMPVDTSVVIAEGQKITKAAFTTLSSNLQQALSEGGVAHALQFCNVEAMPLTDSLSESFNVQLKRASHRPRNPANSADSLEMHTITAYLKRVEQEKRPEPLMYTTKENITYHSPIIISGSLCLNCHGKTGTDITESDLKIIQELYPNDQATGFEMGELRGIWTIDFPRSYFSKQQ